MTSMTDGEPVVFGGVDSHRDTLHVAVIDQLGRPLADRAVPTTAAGYAELIAFLSSHGTIEAVGVEGTSSYGAGVSDALRAAEIPVIEVDRPDRRTRRQRGKSDPVDAYAAAQAVCSGRARTVPKTRAGTVEAIRVLRVARSSAVKARTQTINQLRNLLVTAPAPLRESLPGGSAATLISACVRLRPGATLADPTTATKTALRTLARRWQYLTAELRDLDKQLTELVTAAAPKLVALPGVGTEVAGQLLVTAGDNPHRLRSEAAFAHLCGVAPIPASSGRTDRHRLNRGGDRQANRALWTIALSRLATDPRTHAYRDRRTKQGLSTKDILRCLKRYIARQVYAVLTA